MSYLHYLCLLAYSDVLSILCVAFLCFLSSSLFTMLLISLDCSFLIGSSVFSNVFFKNELV